MVNLCCVACVRSGEKRKELRLKVCRRFLPRASLLIIAVGVRRYHTNIMTRDRGPIFYRCDEARESTKSKLVVLDSARNKCIFLGRISQMWMHD
jgi:hypothetical protein